MVKAKKMTAQQKQPGWGFALLFMGSGLAMMIGMAVSQEGLNAPLWVAEVAALGFFFAGVCILAQSRNWPRLGKIAGLGVVYCLAVPGLWIMLSPDTGSCSSTLSFITHQAGNMECRVVFGIGGIFTLVIAVWMTIIALQGPKGASSFFPR